jgi:hypothetical protein
MLSQSDADRIGKLPTEPVIRFMHDVMMLDNDTVSASYPGHLRLVPGASKYHFTEQIIELFVGRSHINGFKGTRKTR